VILTPTTPEPAWKLESRTNDPLKMYLADLYTVPANLAGLPALSVPMGWLEDQGEKLPVGIQLMGNKWSDQKLLNI
jgi:glutamyl-tRNA(gln) amidotransferase subunit A